MKFEVWQHILADGKIHALPVGFKAWFNGQMRFVYGQGTLWQKVVVPVECYLSWDLGRSDSLGCLDKEVEQESRWGHVLESLEASSSAGLKPQKCRYCWKGLISIHWLMRLGHLVTYILKTCPLSFTLSPLVCFSHRYINPSKLPFLDI